MFLCIDTPPTTHHSAATIPIHARLPEEHAESIALLHQVEHRTPEEEGKYWAKLIKEEPRAELLRRSLLLALESLRRSPSANARKALRAGLALLAYPVLETDSTSAFAFSPDGQYMVTACNPDEGRGKGEDSHNGVARIWKVETGEETGRLWHDSDLTAVAFSPDGKYLATGTKEGGARLWALENHQQVAEMAHDGFVDSVAFTSDGDTLLTTTHEKERPSVHLWDVATRSKRRHLSLPERGSVILGPKGEYLATRSTSNTSPRYLRVWDLSTGKERWQKAYEFSPTAIAISADGQYLAASLHSEPTRVWSLPDGRELFQIPGGRGGMAFSPNGRYLAIGFTVWDLSRVAEGRQFLIGDCSHTLTHEDRIITVIFSPDNRYIASGSQDGTVRVLALSNGEEVARFTFIGVTDVDFSPDGKYLGAQSKSWGLFRLWRLWPDDPVSEACRRVRRNLTYEEWRRYIGDEPYRKTCEAQP